MKSKDVQEILGVSRPTYYKILAKMESEGVIVKRIGKRLILIDEESFNAWQHKRDQG